MSSSAKDAVYLKDYAPPTHLIETVDLTFDLNPEKTIVHSKITVRCNPVSLNNERLVLNGENLQLKSVLLNGLELEEGEDFSLDAKSLTLLQPPKQFTLEITTEVNPKANTALEGLYLSSNRFCTQCEAHGFRRITYYMDRPDVLARFTTKVIGKKSEYPILLSNGNPEELGELSDGRHYVLWVDPFPKPAYLFALVAGDLACLEDTYTTCSGRQVKLAIYVEPHCLSRTHHAMAALKKSMKWDEEVYGLEYDLDNYMIVAVNDFNMGAMENKGLNVFNDKYILADSETATDTDFLGIETVVAHEYFHNWTGNRVTCRDWFQLSLKEGLTVYRDQEFTADVSSRAVRRIEDVNIIRTAQFAEDSGPMAHPIRPASYIEMNNFYTVTVYNKGAEVIRMIATILGEKGFHQGIDLYFARHDGQAVTTDDFVAAMADANDVDFSQFLNWYSQAGTPKVDVSWQYDETAKQLTVKTKQSALPSPGQPEKQPYHIPMRLALFSTEGEQLNFEFEKQNTDESIIHIRETEQEFVLNQVATKPTPSLFRGFSAPVRVEADYSQDDLVCLLRSDNDAFAKWDAGQLLMTNSLVGLIKQYQTNQALTLAEENWIDALSKVLQDTSVDKALLAHSLQLPSPQVLADSLSFYDIDGISEAKKFLRGHLAAKLEPHLQKIYESCAPAANYQFEPSSMANRALRNRSLYYLAYADQEEGLERAYQQFATANNMTETFGALAVLAQFDSQHTKEAMAIFYEHHQDNPLVVDKWLSVQASSERADALENVKSLSQHPAFSLSNPNKVYGLLLCYAKSNLASFHSSCGAGYAFIKEKVAELDGINPQVASRLVSSFLAWKRFDEKRQDMMRSALEELLAIPSLSKNVAELVGKSLD